MAFTIDLKHPEPLLSVGGLEQIYTDGRSTLSQLEHYLDFKQGKEAMLQTLEKIDQHIIWLLERDVELLDKFGVSSEGELQAKFATFYQENGLIRGFSSSLAAVIDGYLSERENQFEDMEKVLRPILEKADSLAREKIAQKETKRIEDYFSPEWVAQDEVLREETEKYANKLVRLIIAQIPTTTANKNSRTGGITVSRGKGFLNYNEHGDAEIDWNRIGKTMTQRILEITNLLKGEAEDLYMQSLFPVLQSSKQNFLDSKIKIDKQDIGLSFLNDIKLSERKDGLTITLETDFGADLARLTEGLKGSFAPNENVLKRRNQEIKKLVLSFFSLTPSVLPGAEYIIDKMLAKDPKMFFVGKNTKKITGLLGEISAYIALAHLLAPEYASKVLSWVGTETQDGSLIKEISIDLALRDIAGIQVKHTSQDIDKARENGTNFIKFSDFDPAYLLNRLQVPSHLTENMANILISEHFNTAYVHRGNKYRHASSGEKLPPSMTSSLSYRDVESAIRHLAEDIDAYIKLFTPELFFMANSDDLEYQLLSLNTSIDELIGNLHGNNLYILATVPYLASTKLLEIREAIENLQSTIISPRTSTSFKLGMETFIEEINEGHKVEVSQDIVSFLNSYGRTDRNKIKKMKSKYRSALAF